jgi:3-oxoacyl-[acyl-carrier protein] reductase
MDTATLRDSVSLPRQGERLAGKVALITGASRGLGRAIALAFAAEGARVVVNYREQASSATAVVEAIHAAGGQAVAIQADAAERHSVQVLLKAAIGHFGRIDILVNNAGINRRGDFLSITDDEWDQIMATNLKGPFMCSQEVFPHMQAIGGGRIINISSAASQYHGPRTVHYAVSKAGLNSLTRLLARYGADSNILVNAIAPGIIFTDQTRDEVESEGGRRYIDMTLLKRFGELGDVAATALLLASDEQNYITGQVISVSGGAYLG